MPIEFESLLATIADSDLVTDDHRWREDGALARQTVTRARLYRNGWVHWLYVGDTALHLAAAGHRERWADWLIRLGADVNAHGSRRRARPLHYAADGCTGAEAEAGTGDDAVRQVRTMARLREAGAELEAHDLNGATALHRAVRTRSAAAVDWLVEAGAEVESRNRSGSTPLHLAVQNTGRGGSGSPAARAAQRLIILRLLAAGANPETRNGRGLTVRQSVHTDWIRELLG